jgi:hypothetical protein
MKINKIKKEVMVCSQNLENINIKTDDTIKQVPKFRYLGIILHTLKKNKDIIQRVKEAKIL